MQTSQPRGISTTIGITIIAVVIVAVGVAIYFVYQMTQDTNSVAFAIHAEDKIVMQKDASLNYDIIITSPDAVAAIDVTLTVPEALRSEETTFQITAGEKKTIALSARTEVDAATLFIQANQGSESTQKSVSVKVYTLATNDNTNSTNNTTNTPITNNVNNVNNSNSFPSDKLQLVDKEVNMTMTYPVAWGKYLKPEKVKLVPSAGSIVYGMFENMSRRDVAGHIAVTRTSPNYVPTDWAGSPYWFAGTINPDLAEQDIIKLIQDAGYPTVYDVQQVTVDGRRGVRVVHYRGYWNSYLSVSYLFPLGSGNTTTTLMISRDIFIIPFVEGDTDAIAQEKGKTYAAQLKDGKLEVAGQRMATELDDAIKTMTFLQ